MGAKARHCMTQRQYMRSVQQVEGLSHVVQDLMRLRLELDLRLSLSFSKGFACSIASSEFKFVKKRIEAKVWFPYQGVPSQGYKDQIL